MEGVSDIMTIANEATATLARPVAWHRKGVLPMLTQFSTKLPLRFWRKVHAREDGCWEWTASRNRAGLGYGQFWWGKRLVVAHRLAYEALVQPIPGGLESDHLCRNRACINPLHIEPVTRSINVLRGNAPAILRARHARVTHCPQGHPYDGSNLRWSRGKRYCNSCPR